MKTLNKLGPTLGLIGALALGACSTTSNPPNYRDTYPDRRYSEPTYPDQRYSESGVVQHIEVVRQDKDGIGLGTVAGAVVGGVAGHQVGSGSGQTAATVLGAAGGAYVGHELENRQGNEVYRITLRMDDGSQRTLTRNSRDGFRVGDRIRIVDGRLQRY